MSEELENVVQGQDDKVYGVKGQTLTEIADAIRDKTGTEELIKVKDMAEQIESIEVMPQGLKDINLNYTYLYSSEYNTSFITLKSLITDNTLFKNIKNINISVPQLPYNWGNIDIYGIQCLSDDQVLNIRLDRWPQSQAPCIPNNIISFLQFFDTTSIQDTSEILSSQDYSKYNAQAKSYPPQINVYFAETYGGEPPFTRDTQYSFLRYFNRFKNPTGFITTQIKCSLQYPYIEKFDPSRIKVYVGGQLVDETRNTFMNVGFSYSSSSPLCFVPKLKEIKCPVYPSSSGSHMPLPNLEKIHSFSLNPDKKNITCYVPRFLNISADYINICNKYDIDYNEFPNSALQYKYNRTAFIQTMTNTPENTTGYRRTIAIVALQGRDTGENESLGDLTEEEIAMIVDKNYTLSII